MPRGDRWAGSARRIALCKRVVEDWTGCGGLAPRVVGLVAAAAGLGRDCSWQGTVATIVIREGALLLAWVVVLAGQTKRKP